MLLAVDFETYYDNEYSLSKMSMVEYLMDPRYQTMGVSLKAGDSPARWVFNDDDITKVFGAIPWDKVVMLGMNTRFDGSILAWKFGYRPKFYLDIMGMAQARIYHKTGSASLANIAKHFGLPNKGGFLSSVKGKRKEQLTEYEIQKLGEYACLDNDLAHGAFLRLIKDYPKEELELIDILLRMYIDAEIRLDPDLITKQLEKVVAEKERLITEAEQNGREALSSNNKFAELLKQAGVEPPTKISPTTGREIFAFAKKDVEFLALQDHPSLKVQALVAARLGVKSTLEEKRLERLLRVTTLSEDQPLPVPLKYYGAHTGRASGDDGYNLQNLTRMSEKSQLRLVFVAPKGKVFVVVDAKQIEARLNAWHAGEEMLVRQFRDGEDVYASFATEIYGQHIDAENHPLERYVGKQGILSLGYGSGGPKFQLLLATSEPPLNIDTAESYRIVDIYRSTYSRIRDSWYAAQSLIPYIASDVPSSFGVCEVKRGQVILPNGMALHYHNLERNEDNDWIYQYGRQRKKLYGAKLIENIIQALARIVVLGKMVELRRDYDLHCKLTVHDDLAFLVPEREAEDALKILMQTLRTPPPWCADCPLDVEGGIHERYGQAK